jgi:hypothetical protein
MTSKAAIPNEEKLVTGAEKSVSVGHQIQGENDDQSDKNGLDNREISRVMADVD